MSFISGSSQSGTDLDLNLFTALHVFFYRLTGGSVGGRFRGAPVLLLTSRGRKTGKRRTTPLLYIVDGKNVVVVASNGGRDKDPSWWLNLNRNPEAEVQIKSKKMKINAKKASEEEKRRLWPLVTGMFPAYNDYQKNTKREIPVVVLEPTTS